MMKREEACRWQAAVCARRQRAAPAEPKHAAVHSSASSSHRHELATSYCIKAN